jgi:uncharacterized RDD family membrane protein YckC
VNQLSPDGRYVWNGVAWVPNASAVDPAQAPVIPNVRFAGFWIRLGAFAIDFVVLEVGAFIIGLILGIVLGLSGVGRHDRQVAGFWLGAVIGLLYSVALLAIFGWTIGMRTLGLQVTNGKSFGPLPIGTAVGRYFASILSGLAVGLGYVAIGSHPQKRAWHDRMAGTWVVHTKSTKGLADPTAVGFIPKAGAPQVDQLLPPPPTGTQT